MSTPRAGWATAFFGALALFFLIVLAAGLYTGELRLPSKGFAMSMQRAANPIGFYVTAMFYAGLAALSAYPLWLLLRHGGSSTVPVMAPRAPIENRGTALNLIGRVSVKSDGPSGEVNVALDGGSHSFWWEFGGGDCLTIVTVPSADEWRRLPALAAYPRAAFLDALAREVGRLQCPSARYEIEPRAILFRQA